MKLIYLLLICAVITNMSCQKQLDIMPENSINFKNGIRNEKDIQSLIGGVEQLVRMGEDGIQFSAIHSYYYNRSSPLMEASSNLATMDGMPSAAWNNHYQIIQQANIPLRYLDQTDMTKERKDYYKGLAYFYKAYAYLWLVRKWGDVVLIKDDVILDPVAKTPFPIVLDYAIDLAEKAIKLLPEYSNIRNAQGGAPTSKFTACKGAAYALLADLASWKAGAKYMTPLENANYEEMPLWEKSANACTQIIQSGQYGLAANPEEVVESVLVGDSRESIYEIDARNYWDEMVSFDPSFSGVTGITPPHVALMVPKFNFNLLKAFSQVLVDSINRLMPTNDLRRYSYFYKIDSLANEPSLEGMAVPNKFRKAKYLTSGHSIGGYVGIYQNWVIWRLAGIYLLRAECRVRLGDVAGAIDDLNIVRNRAKAKPYNSSEGDLRFAIFEEKCKKEMLFESHSYWYDILRNGYAGIELRKNGYDKLSTQDIRDGALFMAMDKNAFNNNTLLRQNIYWFKRFGF